MKNILIRENQRGKVFPYIVCLLASLFFAYELVQFHMMNAISPYLMKDLHMNGLAFGNLCAAYLLADVIFLFPAGIILDHFSTRKVILSALFLCILGTFGFSFATSFMTAATCHFLSGIGNGFCFLSCMMLVSKWFEPKKRPFVMSLVVTVGMLGAVVAQSPFSLLANLFTWRTTLQMDAALGILLFLLIALFVYDNPKQEEQKSSEVKIPFWEGLYRSIFNRTNILLGLYTSWMNMPLMVISAVWGSLFLMQVHKVPLTTASFIAGMISFGTIIGSALFGWLANKTQSSRSWMLFGALSSIVVMFIIIVAKDPSEPLFTVLFFLLGLLTSTQVLSYPLITENNPRELTGTSMGVSAVIIMGLPMLVQPLTGYLLDLGWAHNFLNGMPIYAHSDFMRAFFIFPIGFAIALFSAYFFKSKASKQVRGLV